MDKEIISMIMKSMIEESSTPKYSKTEALEKMKSCLLGLQQKNEFKVGDLVCSKDGLENKTSFPHGFGIVTKVLEKPIFDSNKDSASNYFMEPLDIIVGEISRNGVFNEYHLDSRRLKHYVKDNVHKL